MAHLALLALRSTGALSRDKDRLQADPEGRVLDDQMALDIETPTVTVSSQGVNL